MQSISGEGGCINCHAGYQHLAKHPARNFKSRRRQGSCSGGVKKWLRDHEYGDRQQKAQDQACRKRGQHLRRPLFQGGRRQSQVPFRYSPASLFGDGNCPEDQREDQSVKEYISPHDPGGYFRVALGDAEPGHGDQDKHACQQEARLLQAKLLLEQRGKRPAESRRYLCQRRYENGLQTSRQA